MTCLVSRNAIYIEHDGSSPEGYALPSISCSKKFWGSMSWPLPECREMNRKSFFPLGLVNKVHVFSLEKYSSSLGPVMTEAMVCQVKAQY